MKIYCGLDPSLLGCTVSCVNDKKVVDFLFVHIEKGEILDRILVINGLMKGFLLKNGIKSLTIETPYYNRFNPKVFSWQMRLYQQLIYLCIQENIEFTEKNANSIKKFVLKGRAKKEDTIKFFQENIKYRKCIDWNLLKDKEIEGIIDSILIAICIEDLALFLD